MLNYHHCLREPEQNSQNDNLVSPRTFKIFISLSAFRCWRFCRAWPGTCEFRHLHKHVLTHSQLLPSAVCYCLATLTFHTSTSTASHSSVNILGGHSFMFYVTQNFHLLLLDLWLWRSCLAHGILHSAERMWSFVSQGNMSGFFFYYFFFSSAAFICSSSCVVPLNWVYLTEILSLSIFCMLLSFRQTV